MLKETIDFLIQKLEDSPSLSSDQNQGYLMAINDLKRMMVDNSSHRKDAHNIDAIRKINFNLLSFGKDLGKTQLHQFQVKLKIQSLLTAYLNDSLIYFFETKSLNDPVNKDLYDRIIMRTQSIFFNTIHSDLESIMEDALNYQKIDVRAKLKERVKEKIQKLKLGKNIISEILASISQTEKLIIAKSEIQKLNIS